MEHSSTTLSQLLGIEYLQELQDSFANLTQTTAVMLDADYNLITKISCDDSYFCGFDPDSLTEAARTDLPLYLKNRPSSSKTELYFCPSLGVHLVETPFWGGGHFLGSWFMLVSSHGQKTQENKQLRQWPKVQTPEDNFLRLSSAPPELQHVLGCVQAFAQIIMQQVDKNLEVLQSNVDLIQKSNRLDMTAQMLTTLTNSADVGMYVCDLFSKELLLANNKYADRLGSSLERLLNSNTPQNEKHFDHLSNFCPSENLLNEAGEPTSPCIGELFDKETQTWVRYTNQAIHWVDGRLAHMVTYIDITETKKMQEQLAQLAYVDSSLQLYNALKLNHDLQQMDGEQDISLICFDIVSLRKINNGYSRETGDILLQMIRDWLLALEIPNAALYRIGGDEFLISVPNVSSQRTEELARLIIHRFDDPWIFNLNGEDVHLFCNISLGVIHRAREFLQSDNLISLIDRTLDTARKEGKISIYNEETDLAFKEHLQLELSLKNCIKEGMTGFDVHYQPIVDPSTGIWCSIEALCRWQSPEFGPVPPLVFIHEAEQLGLMGIIGRWVLETAVRQCKQWGLDEHSRFILDVNLSPVQLSDENFVPMLLGILKKYDYPGNKLSLEITESTKFNFSSHTMAAIERLRNYDILVALDDFGTGYSSFNNLKKLPVSLLKTEKAFIDNIENDTYLQHLLSVMVQLAHAADMRLIAEGVETQEQLNLLIKYGVDYVQGYYYSKPLSAADMEKNLFHFFRSSNLPVDIRPSPINLKQLVSGESGVTLSPSLYKMLSQCMQLLLYETDTRRAILEVLAVVGKAFEVNRVYIFWKKEDMANVFSNAYEWCTDDIDPQMDLLKDVDFSLISSSWLPTLVHDGLLLASDVAELDADIGEFLCARFVKSTAVLPLWQGKTLVGFIGLDDCQDIRDWAAEEILMLYNLGMILASVIKKGLLHSSLDGNEKILNNVLGNLHNGVCITNLSSGKIMYANQKIRDVFGNDQLREGRVLQKVLHVEHANHTIQKLYQAMESKVRYQSSWEFQNPATGHSYTVYDSIIPWTEGQYAHLEYTMDISHVKSCERQMELASSSDVLNRSQLISELRHQLLEAKGPRAPVTVCVCNLGFLLSSSGPYPNESQRILHLIKSNIRKSDLIAHYSEGELVVVLVGCTKINAKKKIQLLEQELNTTFAPIMENFVLHYGLCESNESSYLADAQGAEALLQQALNRLHATS